MARSTADFASTTSMIEARLRVRTASMPGEAPFLLFSVILLAGAVYGGGLRERRKGGTRV